MAFAAADPVEAAKKAGLRYVNDGDPGISRQAAGKGFRYLGPDRRTITDEATLGRIRRLAIPPAWTDVWICARDDGHIQAIGRDARGRKQYRYHEDWRAERDETKFARTIAFGRALPRIRRRVDRDLMRRGLGREKVLATMVRLLESTLVRVGNEEYARTNRSVGLSTMRDRHVRVNGSTMQFEFVGKSGKRHRIALEDRELARIVRRVQDLPGQELFQYVDTDGQQVKITSDDVNEYLRTIAGSEFSSKDFRTWAGTVLAAIALQGFERFETKKQAKKNLVSAIERVAKRLGNTPAVCRKCYIHPAILDSYLDGRTVEVLRQEAQDALSRGLPALSESETAVLKFLEHNLRASRQPSLLSSLQRSVARQRQARTQVRDRGRGRETSGGVRAAARSHTRKSPPSVHRRPRE